ncbi:ComEC/Rec2 family competence protein [Holospora curviuscula]|uniref:ComEC family competence protein n=1 Tax=Holospora curviuscula TaxID=1082868 RepID=A0A2S5R7N8_9PROT|nr:ComEC/Rec2 family competence protein [Holospora curviuscula]PPE03359.1 ComEC family competence protein [Holospora curviuscula]
MNLFLYQKLCRKHGLIKIFVYQIFNQYTILKDGLYLRFIQEHDRYILWLPFGLATGIYGYGVLPYEPKTGTYGVLFTALVFSVIGIWIGKKIFFRVLCWGILSFSLGFLRISSCSPFQRLLKKELGPFWIKGKVVALDHTASNSGKLYPRVWIKNLYSKRGPLSLPCVRLGIRTACEGKITPGDWIEARVKLIPWPKPVVPGGYDAQFQQFFQGVSAYGFSVSVVHVTPGHHGVLTQFRHYLTKTFHEKLPYPLGALASALITGDKTALPLQLRHDFSVSGLSHILAISGLHLSIVSAIGFFVFQWLFRWVPKLGLIISLQSLAGIFSLIVGAMYAHVSGLGYPVQRSFILMAGALLGVFLNRWPSSVRLLALCGSAILLVQPQACFSLSFQLSFIATASLMTIPNEFWSKIFEETHHPLWKRWGKNILMMNITTLAATCSTLPWIAFYFHQYSLQSIVSNVFAVSWTSFCVMPMGLLALLFLVTPYSDGIFFLWALTLKGLVKIAQNSEHYLGFLLFHCPLYSQWIFFAQVICVFWWLIWKGSWRWWGVGGLFILHSVAWYCSFNPKILITPDYIGVVQEETYTLWVTDTRKGKYVIAQWARILNLHHICKENTLQDSSIKALFELGKALRCQYPKALTFQYTGGHWIASVLSDENRPWRFQEYSLKKSFFEKKPKKMRTPDPKSSRKLKKLHSIKEKNLV